MFKGSGVQRSSRIIGINMIAITPGGNVIKIGIEQNSDNITFAISVDVCIVESTVRKEAMGVSR